MYTEARKINLIQEVLNVKSDTVLQQLEEVLKVQYSAPSQKPSVFDFIGTLTNEEAAEMNLVISETCEIIHPDDWK